MCSIVNKSRVSIKPTNSQPRPPSPRRLILPQHSPRPPHNPSILLPPSPLTTTLLPRRPPHRRAQPPRDPKIRRPIRILIHDLRHRIAGAVACTGAVGGGVEDVPDLGVGGALEEPVAAGVVNKKNPGIGRRKYAYPLCPGP